MRKTMVTTMAVLALLFAGPALANGGHGGGHGGGGGHGARSGFHGGYHGGYGVGFYFGGPYLGWPYPWPYDYYYYYPYGAYPYAYGDDSAPPPDAGPGPAVPQQQSWYYCDAPQGYYPYVRSCTHPWQAVAPTPPPPK